MSVEFTEKEKQRACEFLQKFAANHAKPIGEDDPLPFRVATLTLSESQNEIEGECIDWSLEYLRRSQAPMELAAIVSRHVVDEILEQDLAPYEQVHQENGNQDEQSQLDTSKLARVVFSKVHEVCKCWSQEPQSLHKTSMQYDISVHAIKNTRRKMEDRHVIITDFNRLFGFPKDFPSQTFFAVYDGHGGADAANYAATHLHCHLARNQNYRDEVEDGVPAALAEAFWKTDEAFGVKARREGLKCGTTGVVALIHGDKLYIAWLGDSQAILSKGGKLFGLMDPHKPEREDEKNRIESLGGCVVWFGAWRVNGSLSVSRAIGDIEHKPYICANPDVIEYEFDGDEDFLILACDGLWDVLKADTAVALVHKLISDGTDRTSIAKELVTYATDHGSSDNITVVVVFLDAHRKENVVTELDNPRCNDFPIQNDDSTDHLNAREHSNGDNMTVAICCDEIKQLEKVDINNKQVNLNKNELVNHKKRNEVQDRTSSTSPNRFKRNPTGKTTTKGSPKLNMKTCTGSSKAREGQSSSVKAKKGSNQLAVKGRVMRSKSAPDTFRVI